MQITAMVREDLKGYTGMREEHRVDVPAGATPADVARQLTLPEVDIRLYVVNNAQAEKTHILQDGDVVEFYPLITGG